MNFTPLDTRQRFERVGNLVIGMGCLLLTTGLLISCGQGSTPTSESSSQTTTESVSASAETSSENVENSNESKPAEAPEDKAEEQSRVSEGLSLADADTPVRNAVEKFDIDLDHIGEPTGKIMLSANKLKFDKHVVVARKGEPVTVTFENKGFMSHNFMVPVFGQKTKTIQPDKKVSITFTPDKIGYFWFYCNVANHKQAGMQGVFVVKS